MRRGALGLLTMALAHTLARLIARERTFDARRAARRARMEAGLRECAYLGLVTGGDPPEETPRRPFAGGPLDWKMTWDMELSVWEFLPRRATTR